MELVFALVSIGQTFAVSLGVGSSTLAILNFFAAIADGTIDETERRMMGVVYVVLRVAMVAILLLTLLRIALSGAPLTTLDTFTYGFLTIVGVLYLNAILMTRHLIPNTIGPAAQAGSWYALGLLTALVPVGFTHFSYGQFLLGYAAVLLLAVAVVNATMEWMKREAHQRESGE